MYNNTVHSGKFLPTFPCQLKIVSSKRLSSQKITVLLVKYSLSMCACVCVCVCAHIHAFIVQSLNVFVHNPMDWFYLLVPCYRRCHQMEVLPENEKVIKLTDDDEGWVDTHHGVAIEQISESVQDMKLDQSSNTPQMVSIVIVLCWCICS